MEKKIKKSNEKKSFIQKLNNHPLLTCAGVFLLFIIFVSISNWSLLIGENLMKYDIWDAEYPSQVLMSDALANKTIPMWNPLMRYGSPYYSFLGTPIWYPITLFLALIGYTPVTVAVCYVLHAAIGGFGMFLLAKQEIVGGKDYKISTLSACLVTGLLYCGCGVFLSNAEHIMIIISATWVPYVFYFVRDYIQRKKIIYGMAAGICAGLILLGGYPEIFYNLFLFLVPYILFFCYDHEKTIFFNVLGAAEKYIVVCICTVLTGAIVLLPFLKNMGLITRGNGLGQIPDSYPLTIFLSMIFPNISQVLPNVERSMVDFYMGILAILLIPIAIFQRKRNKKLYIALSGTAFLLCLGKGGFLHSILYRFFPMYSSFRFATLNRIFMILFLVLLFAGAVQYVMEEQIEQKAISTGKIVLIIALVLGGVTAFIGNFAAEGANFDKDKCLIMANSAFITASIVAMYLLIFWGVKHKRLTGKLLCIVIVGAVCIELLTFSYEEMPYSSTMFRPTEYGYKQTVIDKVNKEFEDNRGRERSTNFANHERSTNGLNSKDIVFNKTFDEEGYQSFLLKRTEDFSNTYIRSIMEQNPEVYFTNNMVSGEDVEYKEWANSCDTTPEQIYVTKALKTNEPSVQKFSPQVSEERELNLTVGDDGIYLEGPISATSAATGHLRLFWEESAGDSVSLQLTFMDSDGNQQQYHGEFALNLEENGKYADIYFPDIHKEYQSVTILSDTDQPVSAKVVVTERLTQDNYVNVSAFGFNSIGMTVEAPSEGYVTILQAMHDGWKAYVDGEEAEIELVNETFMGIKVEPGNHTIVMRFRPVEFFVGAAITAAFILIFMIIIWASMRKKVQRR